MKSASNGEEENRNFEVNYTYCNTMFSELVRFMQSFSLDHHLISSSTIDLELGNIPQLTSSIIYKYYK